LQKKSSSYRSGSFDRKEMILEKIKKKLTTAENYSMNFIRLDFSLVRFFYQGRESKSAAKLL